MTSRLEHAAESRIAVVRPLRILVVVIALVQCLGTDSSAQTPLDHWLRTSLSVFENNRIRSTWVMDTDWKLMSDTIDAVTWVLNIHHELPLNVDGLSIPVHVVYWISYWHNLTQNGSEQTSRYTGLNAWIWSSIPLWAWVYVRPEVWVNMYGGVYSHEPRLTENKNTQLLRTEPYANMSFQMWNEGVAVSAWAVVQSLKWEYKLWWVLAITASKNPLDAIIMQLVHYWSWKDNLRAWWEVNWIFNLMSNNDMSKLMIWFWTTKLYLNNARDAENNLHWNLYFSQTVFTNDRNWVHVDWLSWSKFDLTSSKVEWAAIYPGFWLQASAEVFKDVEVWFWKWPLETSSAASNWNVTWWVFSNYDMNTRKIQPSVNVGVRNSFRWQ